MTAQRVSLKLGLPSVCSRCGRHTARSRAMGASACMPLSCAPVEPIAGHPSSAYRSSSIAVAAGCTTMTSNRRYAPCCGFISRFASRRSRGLWSTGRQALRARCVAAVAPSAGRPGCAFPALHRHAGQTSAWRRSYAGYAPDVKAGLHERTSGHSARPACYEPSIKAMAAGGGPSACALTSPACASAARQREPEQIHRVRKVRPVDARFASGARCAAAQAHTPSSRG